MTPNRDTCAFLRGKPIARRELGFKPTSLEEGVEKTVAFLREQGLVRPKTVGIGAS